MTARRPLLALLATLAAGCGVPSGAPADAPAVPPRETAAGRLVIVGGALQSDNEAVWRAVVEGREGEGPLCVLPTASGVPERSMASAVERFAALVGPGGVRGVAVTVDSAHLADDPGTARRLRQCSGFWFTGGAQSRVVDAFRPDGAETAGYRAIADRFAEGAVVAGSSAGAAMMSDPMIGSGGSEAAFLHGVARLEDGDGVWITRGMGFFPGAFLDQHFLARGRVGRLLVATTSAAGPSVGFGIDENTALVVDGNRARVVGASGVLVVDARGVARDPSDGAVGPVRMHLAGDGDVIDLGTLRVEPAGGKRAVTPTGQVRPEDPFERWAFLGLLAGLSASDRRALELDAPGHRITIRKSDSFRALAADGEGVEGAPAGLHAGPFLVEIVPTG